MRTGQARKRDAGEKAIVTALRQLGALVVPISGHDAPDLLVRWQGRWMPLEVKSEKGRVTAGQSAMGYPVVRSVDEAVALFGPSAEAWRCDEAGGLDDVVVPRVEVFRLERMGDHQWWIGLYREGGRLEHIDLVRCGRRVEATHRDD